MDFAPVEARIRAEPASRRSRPKDYKHDHKDKALRDALHQYRQRRTLEKFGSPALYDIGPHLFMTDEVMDRITDCAHYDMITDGERLQRETRWVWAAEDIEEILGIIRRFSPRIAPPPLTVSTPLQPRRQGGANAASPTVAKPKRPVHCSTCKQQGHTG
jgi:hypothetical protein